MITNSVYKVYVSRVHRGRACRPNQPGIPAQLRPLGEVILWSCRYGSPILPLRLHALGASEALRNCALSCDDGSVNLERGVRKDVEESGGTNRHSAICIWAGRDWGDKHCVVLPQTGGTFHV
jgi:hypothetical protein